MSDNESMDDMIRPKVSDASDDDLYQKAVSHMQYRKQLEDSTPEGCTFKPDIGLSKKFREKCPTKDHDVEVSQRLYREASLRKAKQIDRSLSKPDDCTFTPSISLSQSWTRSTKHDPKSRGSTPTRLYNSTRQNIERREALMRKGEEEELAKCSFKPSISRRPSSAPRVRSSSSKENISHKLYQDASRREESMKKKKEKIESEIKIQSNVAVAINKITSPTSPTITANNSNTQSKVTNFDNTIPSTTNTMQRKYNVRGSFEERMKSADERVSEKIKRKKELLLEQEAKECTFRPRSSSAPRMRKNSTQAESGRPESPAHVRLMSKGEEAKRKIELAKLKKQEDEKIENTFRPKLVAKSPRHGQAYVDTRTPFYERFAKKQLESEQKKSAAKAREEELQNQELTYTPVLVSKKSHRFSSSESAPCSLTVFDRLASAKKEKRALDEEKIKNQLEKELTFKPQIDSKSKKIELQMRPEFENIPVHERLVKDGERRTHVMTEIVTKIHEEEEMANCTFHPDLSLSTESLQVTSAKMGRTPSPMRRGSYMLPTQTSHARATPVSTPDKVAKSPSSMTPTSRVGASPDLRRSSFFQPTKASQARVESTNVDIAQRGRENLHSISPQKSSNDTSSRRRVSVTPSSQRVDSQAPDQKSFQNQSQHLPLSEDELNFKHNSTTPADDCSPCVIITESIRDVVSTTTNQSSIFASIMAEHMDLLGSDDDSNDTHEFNNVTKNITSNLAGNVDKIFIKDVTENESLISVRGDTQNDDFESEKISELQKLSIESAIIRVDEIMNDCQEPLPKANSISNSMTVNIENKLGQVDTQVQNIGEDVLCDSVDNIEYYDVADDGPQTNVDYEIEAMVFISV